MSSKYYSRRQVTAPEAGFGAVLPRHLSDHNRRYFVTTAQAFFGKPNATSAAPATPPQEAKLYQTTNQAFYETGGLPKQQAAGTTVRAGYMSLKDGTKPDLLTGEPWRRHPDPQHNSKVQRTWLYSHDAGIKAREQGTPPPLSDQDNELSLPLGRGDYNKRTLSLEPGAYRRMRQDVTMNPDQYIQLGFRGTLA